MILSPLIQLTAFTRGGLTDLSIGRAVGFWKPGGEAWDLDTMCEQPVFFDSVERCSFRRELDNVRVTAVGGLRKTYRVEDEDFGRY